MASHVAQAGTQVGQLGQDVRPLTAEGTRGSCEADYPKLQVEGKEGSCWIAGAEDCSVLQVEDPKDLGAFEDSKEDPLSVLPPAEDEPTAPFLQNQTDLLSRSLK